MQISISFLALRSNNIEKLRSFYEQLGLSFHEEQHPPGPRHYSCCLPNLLLELYPTTGVEKDRTTLGFQVTELEQTLGRVQSYVKKTSFTDEKKQAILQDPDGRTLILEQLL